MSTPSRVLRQPRKTTGAAQARPSSALPVRKDDKGDGAWSKDEDDTFGLREGEGREEEGQDGSRKEKGREREKRPYFFPPLWLQRRTAIVDLLKQEGVKSVADLGCGHGALLSLLALPAYHTDDFPSPSYPSPSLPSSSSSPSPPSAAASAAKLSLLRSLPSSAPSSAAHKDLHLTHLIGVDADPSVCAAAAEACQPGGRGRKRGRAERGAAEAEKGEEEERERVGNGTRWEDATVEVWQGDVGVYNEALVGVDAIVLTEVIEHLSPASLARLPHLLFSLYKPKLVILTTPNHSFNAYFPPPPSSQSSSSTSTSTSAAAEDSHRYPDPTLRTNRIFRDPTHTLEFTVPEFRAWCADALALAGGSEGDCEYDVEHTGVGSLGAYYSTVSPLGPSLSSSSPSSTPQRRAVHIPYPPPSLPYHPALAHDPALQAPVDPGEAWNGGEWGATQVAIFRRRRRTGEGEEGEGGGEEREGKGEEQREGRSTRPVALPFYTGHSSPSSSSVSPPRPTAAASSSRSPPHPPSSSSPPRSTHPQPPQHTLLSAFTLPAHPSTSLPPSSPHELLAALGALFLRERARGGLTLADIWRLGTDSTTALRQGREGEGGGEEERDEGHGEKCVRELARGRVGAVVDALVQGGEEWEMELVEDDEDQGRGRMVEKSAMERVRVRWRGYVEPLSPDEESGGWPEQGEDGDDDDDEEREDEEDVECETCPPASPSSSAQGWGVSATGESAGAGAGMWQTTAPREGEGEGEGDAAASSGVGQRGLGGWGDDPW
ncbi:hypothetical protein JCM6882_002189 [Rhodosporidiobolus microsporus]